MLGQLQLAWLLVALAVISVLAVAVRSDAWLRTYKYSWAALGVAAAARDVRARVATSTALACRSRSGPCRGSRRSC